MEWTPTVIGFAIAHVVEAIAFVWYISSRLTRIEANSQSNGVEIGEVKASLDKTCDAFDDHVQDSRVHTTEEQRKDISRRIDRLEQAVSDGYRDLGNKLDTWASRILSK